MKLSKLYKTVRKRVAKPTNDKNAQQDAAEQEAAVNRHTGLLTNLAMTVMPDRGPDQKYGSMRLGKAY